MPSSLMLSLNATAATVGTRCSDRQRERWMHTEPADSVGPTNPTTPAVEKGASGLSCRGGNSTAVASTDVPLGVTLGGNAGTVARRRSVTLCSLERLEECSCITSTPVKMSYPTPSALQSARIILVK